MMTPRTATTLLFLALCLGGCSDSDHNGQPDTVRPEVRKAAGQALNTAVKEAGKVAENAQRVSSIRSRLEKDPLVGLYRLRVEVSGGVATLTGEVHTAKEKAQAGKLAREEEGVTSVRNRIQVRAAGG